MIIDERRWFVVFQTAIRGLIYSPAYWNFVTANLYPVYQWSTFVNFKTTPTRAVRYSKLFNHNVYDLFYAHAQHTHAVEKILVFSWTKSWDRTKPENVSKVSHLSSGTPFHRGAPSINTFKRRLKHFSFTPLSPNLRHLATTHASDLSYAWLCCAL